MPTDWDHATSLNTTSNGVHLHGTMATGMVGTIRAVIVSGPGGATTRGNALRGGTTSSPAPPSAATGPALRPFRYAPPASVSVPRRTSVNAVTAAGLPRVVPTSGPLTGGGSGPPLRIGAQVGPALVNFGQTGMDPDVTGSLIQEVYLGLNENEDPASMSTSEIQSELATLENGLDNDRQQQGDLRTELQTARDDGDAAKVGRLEAAIRALRQDMNMITSRMQQLSNELDRRGVRNPGPEYLGSGGGGIASGTMGGTRLAAQLYRFGGGPQDPGGLGSNLSWAQSQSDPGNISPREGGSDPHGHRIVKPIIPLGDPPTTSLRRF